VTLSALRQVDILHGPEGLQQLAPQWVALDRENPEAPFYTSHAWHAAWLHELETEADSVMFIALREMERLVGVMPVLSSDQPGKRLQPRVMEIPRRSGMDLSAPIMAADQQLHEWWPLLRKTLKAAGHSPFIIKMTGAVLQSPQQKSLQGLEEKIITRLQNHSCWFDCRQPHQAVQAEYSTRLKKILRRGARKLAASGEIRLKSWSGQEAKKHAYPVFLQLEASGWKAESGTALALDERARRFHEAFLFNPDATFQPQINLLYAGDEAVAGQLCVRQGNTISLLKIAYAQEMARFSPGSVLLDKLIAACCDDPQIDTISLITGQKWMENWNPQKSDVGDIWLFERSLSARLARGAAGLRDRLRQLRASA